MLFSLVSKGVFINGVKIRNTRLRMANHAEDTCNDVSSTSLGMQHCLLHDKNAGGMELVDNFLWRHTNSAHEELGFALDYDVHELGKLTFRVVILDETTYGLVISYGRVELTYISLARITSYLRDEQVDAKRCIFVLQVAFQFTDCLLQYLGAVPHAPNDTHSTLRMNKCTHELWDTGMCG